MSVITSGVRAKGHAVGPRSISSVQHWGQEAKAELDSHADTCVVGDTFQVLTTTDTTCTVHGFHSKLEPIAEVPVVSAGAAYDAADGTTYLLVVHQALYMPDQSKTYLCPNQMRSNG